MSFEPNGPPGEERTAGDLAAEIAALRHDLERRLARIESRLDGLEEMSTLLRSGTLSPRTGFFGFSRAVPIPPPLPRRPLGSRPAALPGETPAGGTSESGTEAPSFEQGLDVPTASNWSRPLLVVTGGITLFLFLLVQLFCASPPPSPPRKLLRQPQAVPAGQAGQTPPAAATAPPAGTLFVTPSNEPEGTEPAAKAPKPPPH
ncbi:MAG TPA: hypothetical protein VFE33_28010 [Thermoanaerobaculia bacterium]|nr:hypothetical protein [Thermoanaerobaculia bacterium]